MGASFYVVEVGEPYYTTFLRSGRNMAANKRANPKVGSLENLVGRARFEPATS